MNKDLHVEMIVLALFVRLKARSHVSAQIRKRVLGQLRCVYMTAFWAAIEMKMCDQLLMSRENAEDTFTENKSNCTCCITSACKKPIQTCREETMAKT